MLLGRGTLLRPGTTETNNTEMNGTSNSHGSTSSSPKRDLYTLLRYTASKSGTAILAPMPPGAHILDLSLDMNDWILDAAKAYPDASKIIGIAQEDVSTTLPRNVQRVQRDPLQPFPKEWTASFDLVNAMTLFSNTPVSKWPALLDNIYSVLKHGGWVQIVDFTGVYTYDRHVSRVAPGQTVIQGSLEWMLSQKDASLAYVNRLGEYHLPLAGFSTVSNEIKTIHTGQSQRDPKLAHISVSGLLSLLTKARQAGYGKPGTNYTFNGHYVRFPRTKEGWKNLESKAREALQDGMQQQIAVVIAQKPHPIPDEADQYPVPIASPIASL